MVVFGLDISHHQPLSLDLAAARRDGIDFVFLKGTEGASFIDSEFASNLAEARRAGQLVAAYCFVRAGVSAAAHVAHVQRAIPRDVAIIPDVETALDGTKPSLALTREIVAGLRAAGYRVPFVYIPLWYWRDVWHSPSLAGLPPLWSSRYPDNVVGTLADEWADVPARYWDGYGGLPVAVLQFTSSARVAGHQPLDANAFRGTRAELAQLLGAQATPREETDMFEQPDRDDLEFAAWRLYALANALPNVPSRPGVPEKLRGEPIPLVIAFRQLQASNAAIAAAVADGDLDPERLMSRLETAARDEVGKATTAAISSTVLPALREVLTEALGADNAAQADEILSRMAERIGLRPDSEERQS